MHDYTHLLTLATSSNHQRTLTGIGIVLSELQAEGQRRRVVMRRAEAHWHPRGYEAEAFALVRALEVALEGGYTRLQLRSKYYTAGHQPHRHPRYLYWAESVQTRFGELLGSFASLHFGVPAESDHASRALARRARANPPARMRPSPLSLIRNTAELHGTCYIELLPGKYKGTCWMPGSLFLTEELFGFIEPIVQRHVPAYDHYAFTEISRSAWGSIIVDVHHVAERLLAVRVPADLPELGYIFQTTRTHLEGNLAPNCTALAHVLLELTKWLGDTLEIDDCVSVLGI